MTAGQTSIPIIRTKLHRPAVAPDIVCRKALHERLDAGIDFPLALVSAPAGYGKSTLVSHWVESFDRPSAWLSLDEPDGDLHMFLSYFIAAIQTVLPKACQDTQAMLNASGLPPVTVLAGTLSNDLDREKTRFVLVLDDYHAIQNPAVHELLDRLLKHPPQALQLVISTRRDPPLSLVTLRAGRKLTKIRIQDLTFTLKGSAG